MMEYLYINLYMQALCAVFKRKKALYFDKATHLVARLFCHYTFLFLTFSRSEMSSDLPCHYKKTTHLKTDKNIFLEPFKCGLYRPFPLTRQRVLSFFLQ